MMTALLLSLALLPAPATAQIPTAITAADGAIYAYSPLGKRDPLQPIATGTTHSSAAGVVRVWTYRGLTLSSP